METGSGTRLAAATWPRSAPAQLELDVRVVDERAARAELRRQIAALEAQLSAAVADGVSAAPVDVSRGPRILALGELERIRDALAGRVADARAALRERGEREEAGRALLERMLLEPGRYKFVRIANRDLGEPGCGVWQVRPRLGLIGMLMGWWQVKLSSGCPLEIESGTRLAAATWPRSAPSWLN
jgi:hypothetical protein